MSEVRIRKIEEKDIEACAQICFKAFGQLAARLGIDTDFTSVDVARQVIRSCATQTYGVVAVTCDGDKEEEIIGSNFLDNFADDVWGVGPISVSPDAQSKGVGRRLMEAVLDHAKQCNIPRVRLVQDASNTVSFSLYHNLGFKVFEPLCLVRGRPKATPRNTEKYQIRRMQAGDVDACNTIRLRVSKTDRRRELENRVRQMEGSVLEDKTSGEIVAYTTGHHISDHSCAINEEALQQLYLGTIAERIVPENEDIIMLVPSRLYSSFLDWCLRVEKLRLGKNTTLMGIGGYEEFEHGEGAGLYMPSILY